MNTDKQHVETQKTKDFPLKGTEKFNTIVIGGGQAGLALGYYLNQKKIPYVILDANEMIGDSWRKRWDSLRLFTPACLNSLPGMPFPAPDFYFPQKDEMADYLTSYATKFDLPVRSGVKVDRLSKEGDYYHIKADCRQFKAKNVVVAMSNHQHPKVPQFARELDPDILQVHSSEYRNPSQLRSGNVLVVGAGNSGAEISLEVAKRHRTLLSGKDTGHIPFHIEGLAARLFLLKLVVRIGFHHIMTVKTRIGRKMKLKLLSQGGPLVRKKPYELIKAGIERVPRIIGVREGMPLLEDQRILEVSNIIWCTGYQCRFSWIDLPVFSEKHEHPFHYRGIVHNETGLYFTGLLFLYAASSSMIHGTARDAKFIAEKIAVYNKKMKSTDETLHELVT